MTFSCHYNGSFAAFLLQLVPGHMVRAEKMLMDIEEHSLTILPGLLLFHIDKCIHVSEHLRETLVHHCIANLECISLVINIDPIH